MKFSQGPFPYALRIAVLDYSVKHWEAPGVQSMYCKITGLKLRGYWSKHGHDQVIPVDVSDLIGANIATCYDTPEGLVPIMAFRMLTLSRCDLHRIPFPALSVLASSGQDTRKLEQTLRDARNQGRDVVYASSWTRADSIPHSPEAKKLLRDLHTANIIRFMESRRIDEFIACSVLKLRVNEHFEYLGMRRISDEFAQYSVFDQIVAMYHLEDFSKFSAAALAVAERTSKYWEERVELANSSAEITDKTMKAA